MKTGKLILFLIALAILIFVLALRANATTYYVDPARPDDNGNGTSEATAWKTLNKVNSFWSAGSFAPGDNILLKRGGTYYGSINVTESGTSGNPITISNYGSGALPVITGLITLSGWTAVSGTSNTIWESGAFTALPSKLQVLLINGVLYSIGRWPDQTSWKVGVYRAINSYVSNTSITDNSLPSTPNWTGATAVVHSSRWTVDAARITSITNSGRTLNLDWDNPKGMTYPLCSGTDCNGYFIQNHASTLTKFGEWYHNPTTDKIRVYFGATNPTSVTVQASTLANLFVASGRNYITVDGVAFKGANENCFNISGGTGVIIKNCEISYTGRDGINASGTNMLVDNNDILYSYSDAIRMNTANNATITNNFINYNFFAAGMGVSGSGFGNGIWNGINSLCQYNTVLNSGFIGIRVGKSPNTGNISEVYNNFIDTCLFVNDDGGGIYDFVGHDAPGGSDYYVNQHQSIIGNIVLGMVGAAEGVKGSSSYKPATGIYMDDGSNHFDIAGNIIGEGPGFGLFLHNATDGTVTNNTIYNTGATANFSQVMYKHDALGWAVKDIVTTGNVFFSKSSTQFTAQYISTTMAEMTWNNNYYARPISETGGHIKFNNNNYNLTQWKSATGKDANSTITWPSPITSGTEVRFIYNELKVNKVVPLSGTYKDIQGNTFVCSITLSPFTGKVLIKTSPTTCATNIFPTVSITSPANGASFVAPASIPFVATASDADGTITKVEFYNGATLFHTEINAPYEFSWNSVPIGNYSITARAYDNAGGITSSSAIAITVTGAGNLPPTVSITGPANNSTYTSPATIPITATASDPDGSISSVAFYNGESLLNTDNSSPYSYTWTSVAAGTHFITARATDNNGAVTTSSGITVVVSDPPNLPPTVSISSPANNTTYVAPVTVPITASSSDADGTISHVSFYTGQTLIFTDVSSPFAASFNVTTGATHVLTARATDDDGATTTSSPITIVVNNPSQVYPSVSMTSPIFNATYTAPASIVLSADAADADGTITKVEFFNGATLINTELNAPYSVTWSNVPVGNYSLTAKATDNSGNVTTSTAIAITVTNALPVVNITSPTTNSSFLPSATINFNATATDANGTIANVKFYDGSTLFQTETAAPYQFTRGGFATGSHTITAVATDNLGATTTSSPVTFTISANPTPTVNITAPTNGQSFTSHSSTIALTATATDDGSIANVKFYSNGVLLNTDNSSPYTFNWTNVSVGTKSITATATDNLGAIGTSNPVSITVNNVLPTVSITVPTNGATFVAPGSIAITATASDANGSVSKVDFYNGSALIGTDNSSPYNFTWTSVPTGTYILTAKATDDDGDVTTSSEISVTVTNTPPEVSLAATVISANPWMVYLEATVTDVNGSIVTVDFYEGTTLIATEVEFPYEYTVIPTGAGSYTFTVVATDDDGATTTSNEVTITLAAPTISITDVTVTEEITPGQVDITATATDNSAVAKVDFYANGILIGTDNSSPYTFSWTGVANGVYVISAIATDDDGATTTSADEPPIEILAGNVSITNLLQTYDGTPKPVDVTVDGGWPYDVTYDGSPTVPTNAGIYEVEATTNDGIHFGSATETLVIAKANPIATWEVPNPITYLTPLSDSTLDATADVPGTFAYTPPSGTVLGGGTQTLTAIFTPTDITNYNKDTVSVNLVVNKAPATIAITSATSFAYDGTAKAITAVATPNVGVLRITYNGNIEAPKEPGIYTIAITLQDNNYEADLVSGTLEIIPPVPGPTRNFLLLNRSRIANKPK